MISFLRLLQLIWVNEECLLLFRETVAGAYKKHCTDCSGILKFHMICEEHPGGSRNFFFMILKLFYIVLGLYVEHQSCQCFRP